MSESEDTIKFFNRLVNEKDKKRIQECEETIKEHEETIKFLDQQILMLERRNKRQEERLQVIYDLISKLKWDQLYAMYMDLNKNYDV